MIASFHDESTADIYHGRDPKAARRIRRELWPRIVRKLDLLENCRTLEDLRAPPANHLEKLKGDLEGLHSIRVNDQYRIVFRFSLGEAHQVRVIDYH